MFQYSEGEAEIFEDELQSLKVDWQVIENHWIMNTIPNCVFVYLDSLE